MNIIVSGGGTGGHIYPALTIITAIKEIEPTARFLYVGTNQGLEADIVPREGLDFTAINLEGFERHFTMSNFYRLFRAFLAVLKARSVVNEFKPDVAIGTGGYVAGPILLASSLAGVPTLIQEQNAFAGVTNKLLASFVSKIAVGMEEATSIFPKEKTIYTGNPIRSEVMTATRIAGANKFGFDPSKKTVLISGGSRGARTINYVMVEVLKRVSKEHNKDVQYLHITGSAEYDEVMKRIRSAGVDLANNPNIRVEPYLYDMPSAIAMADIAVFRAGATGLAELAARGVPAILIPYPYAAENHQEKNARAVERAGGAEVILNSELTPDTLMNIMTELLNNENKRKMMARAMHDLAKPEAATTIARLAVDMGYKKKR